jgi:hypothetical protein
VFDKKHLKSEAKVFAQPELMLALIRLIAAVESDSLPVKIEGVESSFLVPSHPPAASTR